MKISCNLKLTYDNEKQAKQVFESVHVDDASFMNSTQQNNIISTTIQTKSVASMLHTIDDFLACIRVAENIITKNSKD
jgi:tRNA threonylcarbamoyladenosine modification (KEOPS) complex  Pcc1 subunit